MRQAGNGRVSLDAAPVAPQPHGNGFAGEAEQVQRRDHVRGFQRAKRLAGERQSVLPTNALPRPEPGMSIRTESFLSRARSAPRPRRRNAVVDHGQRQRTTGLLRERRAVIRVDIPAGKFAGRFAICPARRSVHKDRESRGRRRATCDQSNCSAREIRRCPRSSRDDGVPAHFANWSALKQFGGDGLAVFPDGGDFGSGRAAVRADENFLAHV
jgi:hypothetical protein